MENIYDVTTNDYGFIVIDGVIGTKRFLYYTRQEAIAKYISETERIMWEYEHY